MDTHLSEKIIDAIRLTIKNSNPFEKSNLVIKRVSLMVFLTFGFTVINYFTLKNIAKVQLEWKDNMTQLENKIENTIKKRIIKVSRSTSTSDLCKNKTIEPIYVNNNNNNNNDNNNNNNNNNDNNNNNNNNNDNNDDDELLDDCYDNIPCSNVKKTTSPKYLFF
jgi:hypothetical protein